MSYNSYKSFSLRNRIFLGFLIICVLSIMGSAVLSYFVLKQNIQEKNKTEIQKKSNALMASLDYAVSQKNLVTADLSAVLENEIYEIADIHKQDIILYDLQGKLLLTNNEAYKKTDTTISKEKVKSIVKSGKRVDQPVFDEKTGSTKTSSYTVLYNNMLAPIAIVYSPLYYDDSLYLEVFNKYVSYIILIDIFIIAIGIWLSWIISKNLTNALTRFSEKINRITLFEKEMQPIRYYQNDELGSLVKSYNKMILQIQDQKERLRIREREEAWREMAKQVAHEVKNPLTPMKLTIQNFERKFDPKDPQVTERVHKLCASLVDQIDTVATVANAFSTFAKLPEKKNEIFNLNKEVENILGVFSNESIYVHANNSAIMINMDKIYLNRIVTNIVNNSLQAKKDSEELLVNVYLEQIQKRITISIEDNGIGIAHDTLDKIFEPNFTSKNSGMGLGLTMVRKMVEDYKGEILVNSEEGTGTKVTITLPSNL